jgi:hypothetical protein
MFNNDEKEVNEFELCNISPEKTATIMVDKISESFCPIIFLGEDRCLNNPSPVTESLRTLGAWNTLISTTEYSKCIKPIHDKNTLLGLDCADINIASELIRQKILSDVYGTFISALDQGMCERKDLLHYFYIRETVYHNLQDTGIISAEIKNLIHNAVHCFTSHNVYDENKLDEQAAVLINISGLLSTAVISAINCSIESAVNDIMYRIHVVPNQNDIERKLRSAFNLNMGVNEGFWIYAAATLKGAIINDIDPYYSAITKTCKDSLLEILYTNSFTYIDSYKDLHIAEKNKKQQQ